MKKIAFIGKVAYIEELLSLEKNPCIEKKN
jgi:hypothetical protein